MEKILVLANSVMHKKSCIAGKKINTKEWIRLKGDRIDGISRNEECLYRKNCSFFCNNEYLCFYYKTASLLDIIKVSIKGQSQIKEEHQSENYKFDSSIAWECDEYLKKENIEDFLDNVDSLWDEYSSTDRISKENLPKNSLYFIDVPEINLYRNHFNKRRANIKYKGKQYNLGATTKNFDILYSKYGETKFSGYVTISLGEIYHDYAYKLVAGILEK